MVQARQVVIAPAVLLQHLDVGQRHGQHVVDVMRDGSRGQPGKNAPLVGHQRLIAAHQLARVVLHPPHGPAGAGEDQQGRHGHVDDALDRFDAPQFLDGVGGPGSQVAGKDDIGPGQQHIGAGQVGSVAGALHALPPADRRNERAAGEKAESMRGGNGCHGAILVGGRNDRQGRWRRRTGHG
jgi:hypothetical protein